MRANLLTPPAPEHKDRGVHMGEDLIGLYYYRGIQRVHLVTVKHKAQSERKKRNANNLYPLTFGQLQTILS